MAKNKFTQSTEIKKLSNDKYYAHKEDLYFALERITSKNIEFWKGYADNQDELCGRNNLPEIRGIKDTTNVFIKALKYYNDNDVWVAYATMKDISKVDYALNYVRDIEICLTVGTNKNLPFTTHLGIFKSYEFSINEYVEKYLNLGRISEDNKAGFDEAREPYKDLISHKGLSTLLHSFAAKATQEAYGNKYYMITRPNYFMFDILKKNLSSEIIYDGSVESRDLDFFNLSSDKVSLKLPSEDKSGDKIALFERPTFWYHNDLNHGGFMLGMDINKLANKVRFDILGEELNSENIGKEPSNQSTIMMNEEESNIEFLKHEVNIHYNDSKDESNLSGALEHLE